MTVRIEISRESERVLIDIGKHLFKHRAALTTALHEVGSEVVNETARLIFNGPKTGRIYNIRGTRHQASAPGEAPAHKTGRLARSADYKVRNFQEMVVGETAEYAKFLEEGTRKMDPRPHLIVAVRNKARDTEVALLDAVDRGIHS